jgi:hypothetical protein
VWTTVESLGGNETPTMSVPSGSWKKEDGGTGKRVDLVPESCGQAIVVGWTTSRSFDL